MQNLNCICKTWRYFWSKN